MQQKVLVIHPERCTGCRKCEMVCSVFHYGESNLSRSLIKIIKWEHLGFYLPVTCQNCAEAFCTEVCPAQACHRDLDTQKVVIDGDKCIGCKTCVLACPFGVPFFDETLHVSVKCDFCGGDPQCVACCETKAIEYTEIDAANLEKRNEYSVILAAMRGYEGDEQVLKRISGGLGMPGLQ
jgi:carbon-monoxide dehydrogenase iron sulfur subunit